MSGALLEARHLTRRYRQGGRDVTVLDSVSLTLRPGEVVMITGRSGSGKSTLLNLLGGLDLPQVGSLQFACDGATVDLALIDEARRTRLRRRYMGFVFQLFNLLPTLTACENAALPAELNGLGQPLERARKRLVALGLGDRLDAFPEALSGGEQQRVAIARALVHEPALLLADEPTGNLDRETGDEVFAHLLRCVREANSALVMVTHDRELAAAGNRRLELGSAPAIAEPR